MFLILVRARPRGNCLWVERACAWRTSGAHAASQCSAGSGAVRRSLIAEHVPHAIEPLGSGSEPSCGLERALNEYAVIGGAMGQDEVLAHPVEEHRVFVDDIACANDCVPDAAWPPQPDTASRDRNLLELLASDVGDDAAEGERCAGWSIFLFVVVSFEDLHLESLGQLARGLAYELW